jgi:predicted AlkP superfamily phosphohydrolase/phosphomutase
MHKDCKSILFIGLDGATWALLKPWINKGLLPTFQKLIKNGIYGNLKSTIPALTAPSWTSIATGKNPGKHGVYDFEKKDGSIITSKDIGSERIWNIASDHGLKCCVINYPLTYPPEKINGIMVSDWLTPAGSKNIVFPSRLKKLLKKIGYKLSFEFEKYGIADKHNLIKKVKIRDKLIPGLYEAAEKRFKLAKKLIKKSKWDLFVLVLNETDILCHFFWDRKDVILNFYKFLDEKIKELISVFSKHQGEPIVIIVSDHGFGKSQEKEVNLYPIMRKLKINSVSYLFKLLSYVNTLPYMYKLIKLLSRIWLIRKFFVTKYVHYVSKIWGTRITNKNKTSLFINKLKEMKDESGEKIFREIYRKDEIYTGKYLEDAPDVVYVLNPKYRAIFLPINKIIIDSLAVTLGDHFSYRNGIFLISNRKMKTKTLKLNVEDITPIILYLLNLPIPSDMDGKVPKILIRIMKRNVKYKVPKEKEMKLIKEKISLLKSQGRI